MKKWANIRDSFVKSLRTETGQGFQKKYLHAEQLNFLLKVVDKADTENPLTSRPCSSTSNTPELNTFTDDEVIQFQVGVMELITKTKAEMLGTVPQNIPP